MNTYERFKRVVDSTEAVEMLGGTKDPQLSEVLAYAAKDVDHMAAVATVAALITALDGGQGAAMFLKTVAFLTPAVQAIEQLIDAEEAAEGIAKSIEGEAL